MLGLEARGSKSLMYKLLFDIFHQNVDGYQEVCGMSNKVAMFYLSRQGLLGLVKDKEK
jgi:hypothetical protein